MTDPFFKSVKSVFTLTGAFPASRVNLYWELPRCCQFAVPTHRRTFCLRICDASQRRRLLHFLAVLIRITRKARLLSTWLRRNSSLVLILLRSHINPPVCPSAFSAAPTSTLSVLSMS